MNQTNDYQNLYQPGQTPPKAKHPVWVIAVIVLVMFLLILSILVAIFVPAMIGYTRKSNLASANSAARNCAKCINTALVDLDAENKLKTGTYIITNDPGFENVNLPFDAETESDLLYKIRQYQGEDRSSYYYFAVVEGAEVTYTAVGMIGRNVMIGTYPKPSEIDTMTLYDGSTTEKDKNTDIAFVNLYHDTREQIATANAED